jgi:chaperonin GroES
MSDIKLLDQGNEIHIPTITLKENRVLIKKFGLITKTAGGLILPDDQQVPREGGTVVVVGPDVAKTACKVGDRVRYVAHGMEVEIDGEKYYLCRDTDVWGDLGEEKKEDVAVEVAQPVEEK